jgi:glycopeptide antibiotics resistance protein
LIGGLLACYMIILLSLTLAPDPSPPAHLVNLIPFKSILAGIRRGGWLLNVNVFGNIAAFVPLGLLVPAVSRRFNLPAAVLWLSLLTSGAIEICQWALGWRVADVDDLLLNIAGGLVGYGCYTLLAEYAGSSPEYSAQK